jgi:hypothetical protein
VVKKKYALPNNDLTDGLLGLEVFFSSAATQEESKINQYKEQ